MVYRVLESGPQMLSGVGAPGPPMRAVLNEYSLIRRQAQLLGSELQPKVTGGKGVRIAKAAHRDHLGGPGADSWQGQQLCSRAVPVTSGIQDHGSIDEAGDEGTQRPLPGLGHGQMDGIDLGKLFD